MNSPMISGTSGQNTEYASQPYERINAQVALPEGQRETSLQNENFPTPESMTRQQSQEMPKSRSLWDYCANTLKYIGEHPVEFALSIGASMAVRYAVTAGIIAISGGAIAGLALTIASAMIASVVMNVGRSLIKGEKVDFQKAAGSSLFSGAIAGVIGAFLGGAISPPEAAADVANSAEHAAKPFTEHYTWKMDDNGLLRDGTHLTPENSMKVEDGSSLSSLLRSNKEWFVITDSEGCPQAVHRNALMEMSGYVKETAKDLGMSSPALVDLTHEGIGVSSREALGLYKLEFGNDLLSDKDLFKAAAAREMNFLDLLKEHGNNLSPAKLELLADNAALAQGNYNGLLELHVRSGLENPLGMNVVIENHASQTQLIRNVMEHAASATPEVKAQFAEQIKQCQELINNSNGLDKGTVNLNAMWNQVQQHAGKGMAPDEWGAKNLMGAERLYNPLAAKGSWVDRVMSGPVPRGFSHTR